MQRRNLKLPDLVSFDPEQGLISFCGRRAVLVQADAMGALRKELIDTLGLDIAKVILTRFGYSCGQSDARHLHALVGDDVVSEFVLAGPKLHMLEGVVCVETHALLIDPETGHYDMSGIWKNSYEAEQHIRLFGISGDPACWTVAGYASGFSSVAFDTPMICIEDHCVAGGHTECSWRLIAASKCGPEHDEHRRLFMPLNLQEHINVLEQKVQQRTAALAASESRYRDLVDNLSEIIFSLDGDGQLVHLNRAGRYRLGLAADGEMVPLARLMAMPHRRRLVRFLRQVRESGAEGRIELALRSLRGEEIPAQMQISPVMDGARLAGYRGLAIDISQRQARERKLTEYASSLESQLVQATRLAGLGQFASGIAHEINNPMGLISAYAEDLLDTIDSEGGDLDVHRLRRGLATIQEQAYRCKFITQNVLSFARDQVVNLEATDLGALVRDKVAFFSDRARVKTLDIRLTVNDDLPPVHTDPSLIGQVLLNLLKNAAEAMDSTGGLFVTLGRFRNRARLEVADDGPGLAPEVMEKVFDPFFTTKEPDKGTGLGLSICYGIVRSLGGTITCGNRTTGGAWFRVSLPLSSEGRIDR
ncbi:MAG: XylR N-terminal domain-containing protein [Phaeospirillum sp.]|nr:XylR N-terminal domain-containing protein [Phaeospirillum sp.]